MRVEISYDDKEVKGMLQRLLKVTSNLRPAMKNIGEIVQERALYRIEDKSPSSWPHLKKSTIKQRTKKGYIPVKILRQSGDLARSISYAAHNDYVEIGSNWPYARIHQLGGKAGKGRRTHIPARPYLGITNEDRAEIRDVLLSEIKRAAHV